MANNRDEELLGSGDEFYEQDDSESEEFQIPADEFDDALSDDLELTEDDIADISNSDDSELFFGDDESEASYANEYPSEGGDDGDDNPSDETETEDGEDEPEKSGPGWKVWAGVVLVAVIASGGMAYMVLPDSSSAQSAPQQTRSALPQENPAPPEPPQKQALPQQVSEQTQVADQNNVSASIDTERFYEPKQNDVRVDDNGSSGVIKPPRRTQAGFEDHEPEYLKTLTEQRAAFESIAALANQNQDQITRVDDQLVEYQTTTDDEVADLERRVTRLEKLLKNQRSIASLDEKSVSNSSDEKAKAEDSSANVMDKNEGVKDTTKAEVAEFTPKVPKTPAEIKALQQRLKDYGYRPGEVDGVLGAQTRWAIKRLQEEHGLPINGWLSAETLAALEKPKHYSGTYPEGTSAKVKVTKKAAPKKPETPSPLLWYVRGVTPTKAVVYRQDGMSYAVSVGSEIPGMGQVTKLDTDNLKVITAKGSISRR